MTDSSLPSSRGWIRTAFRQTGLHASGRAALGLFREAPVWPRLVRQGRGPVAVFLPSQGREMSSLLRIYNIAEALQPLGWRTIVLPPTLTLAQRRRLIDWAAPDVVVMQGARHPLNRPDLYPGNRIVYDMDDADFHLPHLARPVQDAMPQVTAVIAGSRFVAEWCAWQGAKAHVVWTGAPVSPRRRTPQANRPPVVAWAQSAPVDYTHERAFVLDVMTRLAAMRPGGVCLRLFGRRPGDDGRILQPFREAGIFVDWVPVMGYRDYLAALDDVAVGLAPLCPENPFSRGKSFGKILAYLDRGVPIIASDQADHGQTLEEGAVVLTDDRDRWAAELERLLVDPAARQAMADRASAIFRDRLSVGTAASKVDRILRQAVGLQTDRDEVPAERGARPEAA
jgi:hypothetical protein